MRIYVLVFFFTDRETFFCFDTSLSCLLSLSLSISLSVGMGVCGHALRPGKDDDVNHQPSSTTKTHPQKTEMAKSKILTTHTSLGFGVTFFDRWGGGGGENLFLCLLACAERSSQARHGQPPWSVGGKNARRDFRATKYLLHPSLLAPQQTRPASLGLCVCVCVCLVAVFAAR